LEKAWAVSGDSELREDYLAHGDDFADVEHRLLLTWAHYLLAHALLRDPGRKLVDLVYLVDVVLLNA